MMIDIKFRKLMLDYPEVVRNSVLSCRQIEVALYLIRRNGPVYTSEVAIDFEMSVPNASILLKTLCDRGYAKRKQVVAPTGGIEYQYMPIEGLAE